MAPVFPTIGEPEEGAIQFILMARFIYGLPNVKEAILKSKKNKPPFTNISQFPASLEELCTLFLNEPITEQDRDEFIHIYRVPFMSTGKRLEELYRINPEVMTPVLDSLIHSKRIQRLISPKEQMYLLQVQDAVNTFGRTFDPDKKLKLETSIPLLIKEYRDMNEEQEVEIANAWIRAVEQEPAFQSTEQNVIKTLGHKKIGQRKTRRRKSRKNTVRR